MIEQYRTCKSWSFKSKVDSADMSSRSVSVGYIILFAVDCIPHRCWLCSNAYLLIFGQFPWQPKTLSWSNLHVQDKKPLRDRSIDPISQRVPTKKHQTLESIYGGFLSHGGTEKSSILDWDVPWHTPSSDNNLGVPPWRACPFGKNRGAGLVYHLSSSFPIVKGVSHTPLVINQPTIGNLGHLWPPWRAGKPPENPQKVHHCSLSEALKRCITSTSSSLNRSQAAFAASAVPQAPRAPSSWGNRKPWEST